MVDFSKFCINVVSLNGTGVCPIVVVCRICIVLWMEPNVCICSMRCFAKFEVWPFVLNVTLCSLNHAKIFLPVCPTYTSLQSGHVSLYTPDCVYVSELSVMCFFFFVH